MTARTATWVSRSLVAIGVCALIATWVISARTAAHPVTAPVVVGDPTIADGPAVLRHIQHAIADGAITNPTALSLGTAATAAILLMWIVTGSLIVSRQPKNLAGWVFVAIGASWMIEGLCVSFTLWGTIGGGRVPLRGLLAVIGDNALLPFVLLPLLFLLFPDGHAPARWRWVVWTMFTGLALVIVGYVLGPGPLNNYVDAGVLYVNPIGVGALAGTFGAITGIGGIIAIVSGLATVPAVRGRYKRSTGETRQQLRWLVLVATLAGVLLLIGIVGFDRAERGGHPRTGVPDPADHPRPGDHGSGSRPPT